MRFIFLIFLFINLINCGSKSKFFPVKSETDKEAGADLVIRNFSAQGYQVKTPQWDIYATEAYLIYSKNIINIYQVVLNLYQTDSSVYLTASKGTLFQKENKLEITGNVIVINSDGKKLETESLTWYEKEKRLVSNKPVKITFPEGDVLSGSGLRADTKLNKITLLNGKLNHSSK